MSSYGHGSSSRVAALIAAAGSGTRLGSGPKALLRLGGTTLLDLTLEALDGAVDEVLIAVPAEHVDELSVALPGVRVMAGGSSRQRSVRGLVAACRSDLVVVHDVARPFLPATVLQRVIAAARRHGAASAAVAVADTVVTMERDAPTEPRSTGSRGAPVERGAPGGAGAGVGDYGRVIDRSRLRAIQTPQAFDRDLLATAHAAAAEAGVDATDDAGLVRLSGHHVALVEGSRLLMKITEPADLLFAEALLPCWRDSLRKLA